MKIRMTLKDPDGISEGVKASVFNELRKFRLHGGKQEAAAERRLAAAWKHLEQWVESEDYVTLEFDTVARTAVALPRKGKKAAPSALSPSRFRRQSCPPNFARGSPSPIA